MTQQNDMKNVSAVPVDERDLNELFKGGEGEKNPTAEEIKAMTEAIFSIENMTLRANISELQSMHFARARAFLELYDCNLLADVLEEIRENSVSIKALGRRDLRAALMSLLSRNDYQGMEQKKRGFMAKLLGKQG